MTTGEWGGGEGRLDYANEWRLEVVHNTRTTELNRWYFHAILHTFRNNYAFN